MEAGDESGSLVKAEQEKERKMENNLNLGSAVLCAYGEYKGEDGNAVVIHSRPKIMSHKFARSYAIN
jgi:hypothetical protein